MRTFQSVTILAGLFAFLPLTSAAQAPAERSALLALLDSVTSIDTLEQLDRLVVHAPSADRNIGRMRGGFLSLRRGELSGVRKTLIAAGDQFFAVSGIRKDWPLAWYGVGLVDRALAVDKHPFQPTRFNPAGFDYNQSAVLAFGWALKVDSTFTLAADGMAGALEATTRWGMMGFGTEQLRRIVNPSASVLGTRARLEREAGERDSSASLFYRALAGGADSGVTLIEVSREQFLKGAIEPGRSTYFKGVALANSANARDLLIRQLKLTALPGELDGLDTMSSANRVKAVREFWTRRDIEGGRQEGDRLREHMQRYEVSRNGFRINEQGMTPTDRTWASREASRAIYRLGVKDSVRRRRPVPTAQTEFEVDKTVQDAFDRMFGPNSDLLDSKTESREFKSTGRAYMRYGPADDMAGNYWLYRRPTGNLIIPVEASYPGGACDLDLRFCVPPTPENLRKLKQILDDSWDSVLVTERSQRDFPDRLNGASNMYGLLAQGDIGRILVSFAVQARQLHADSTGEGWVYPVRLQIMAAPASGVFRIDHDTTRLFRSARRLGENEWLQGTAVLTAPVGSYKVRTVLEVPGEKRGVVRSDDDVTIERVDTGVVMSDLMLGKDESKLTWWSGVDRVRLNPSGIVRRSETLFLHYQLGALIIGESYATNLEVFDGEGAKTGDKPLIALSYDEVATGRQMELQRLIGVQQLEPGLHTLRLTIRNSTGNPVAQRIGVFQVE